MESSLKTGFGMLIELNAEKRNTVLLWQNEKMASLPCGSEFTVLWYGDILLEDGYKLMNSLHQKVPVGAHC